jgi:phosphohistidine phosphatase
MKRLYVMRHAKAVDKGSDVPDFERSLVAGGKKDSRRAGKKLAKEKLKSVVIVSSPANRALETAHAAAASMKYPVEKILLKEAVYEADHGSAFVDLLRGLDQSHDTAVLVGHEPTLSQFIQHVGGGLQHPLPKAGVVGLEFSGESWETLGNEPGSIFYFDFPINKDDRKRLEKRLAKQIEYDVADSMVAVMSMYSPKAADKMRKGARKAGKDAARRLVKIAGCRNLLQQYMVHLATRPAPVEPTVEAELEPEPKGTESDPATV